MDYIVQTKGLTKRYDGHTVVSDVSFSIKKGEIYGFLGPNGAGKSTIMKMLINAIKPTSGEIELFGSPVREDSFRYLQRIGSMIEHPIFYEKLTARENLELHCAYMGYHNKQTISDVLEWVDLSREAHKRPHQFSLGMRQRLCVARAILTKPELVILDEPINGLDPEGIQSMRRLLKKLNKEYGMTLFISSHIIGEIEQIADTIGMIKDGTLIEETSMETLKEQNTEYIELVTNDPKKAAVLLHDQLNITNFKIIENQRIRIFSSEMSHASISKALILEDIEIHSIQTKQTTLEEYFIKKIGLRKNHQ
ncbi:ABC transporter ATP-binding protein [Shouchella lehensis]|uniref:ABC transporter ATP-binding protein n=1 Tax=Shouchella lehensis TaxID=300825 RepID=A0A4Y7WK05_9BACI|nr:ABC transporter ATP-binding protein [Shouchella lehensis]MBG9785944.1 bacitracin ABC transporter ATP-binding protein [Shouchella lehensis]TES48421.1 ABC transporter ATP-binding protein [Shouchella lehensis]